MDMQTRIAEIVREIFARGWGEGDFSGLAAALGAPFTFHVRGTSAEMDLGALIGIVAGWRDGFPDLRFEIEDLVAADDVVAVRARLVGTHLGRWGDHEPTGRHIDVDHMFFLRFDDDRLVDVYEMLDQDALRRQIST